jgi:hypothetical protein
MEFSSKKQTIFWKSYFSKFFMKPDFWKHNKTGEVDGGVLEDVLEETPEEDAVLVQGPLARLDPEHDKWLMSFMKLEDS